MDYIGIILITTAMILYLYAGFNEQIDNYFKNLRK